MTVRRRAARGRRAAPVPLALAAAAALALVTGGCASSGRTTPATSGGSAAPTSGPTSSAPATRTASTTPPTSSSPPAPDTSAPATTPADGLVRDGDGTRPQVGTLPDPGDPAFLLRVRGLWDAIERGDPTTAAPLFFPLDAYRQVKAISDPDADYQNRLLTAYRQDIASLHQQVGGGAATFDGIDVPTGQAQWITPGVESNKGSYWRVYGTELRYTSGGQPHTLPVTSLISWRGQWYVVHLGAIR